MDNSKDLLLIENIVKLNAMNNLLIRKGILSEQEIVSEMTEISKSLVEQMKSSSIENSTPATKIDDI